MLVRIIATSRAVRYAEEIRGGVVSFPSFSGFLGLRGVTMSELRERCRLLAIWVCRELRVGQINGTPKWCGVLCVCLQLCLTRCGRVQP